MRNNKARKALLVVSAALSAALLVGWSWDECDRREDRKDAREERGISLKSVAGTARPAVVYSGFVSIGTPYGDTNTERAVMKALRWLKATQEPDGSWGTKPELGLTKEMDKAAGAGFAGKANSSRARCASSRA